MIYMSGDTSAMSTLSGTLAVPGEPAAITDLIKLPVTYSGRTRGDHRTHYMAAETHFTELIIWQRKSISRYGLPLLASL
jgi:hypothetical protein